MMSHWEQIYSFRSYPLFCVVSIIRGSLFYLQRLSTLQGCLPLQSDGRIFSGLSSKLRKFNQIFVSHYVINFIAGIKLPAIY